MPGREISLPVDQEEQLQQHSQVVHEADMTFATTSLSSKRLSSRNSEISRESMFSELMFSADVSADMEYLFPWGHLPRFCLVPSSEVIDTAKECQAIPGGVMQTPAVDEDSLQIRYRIGFRQA